MALPRVTVAATADAADDAAAAADAVVVATTGERHGARLADGAKHVDQLFGGRITPALAALDAKGRAGEVLRIPTLGEAPFPLVVATGLGPDGTGAESVRRAVGAALRELTGKRRVHVAVDGPLGAIVEGALLGAYSFAQYKSDARPSALRTITVAAADGTGTNGQVRRARALAQAVWTARDLVNTPANDLYPETFADRIAALAAHARLDVEVLGPQALARGGYRGIIAVGSGSARPPRLLRLAYRPARAVCRVALVGKGVTFDSGGLNLKSRNLTWMKSDMAGGAAVLAATIAAASLRLPLEIVATVPMAENMPSGSALRPSDIITMRSGRTVEVSDTDAEGRLLLGDAIDRALEDDPDVLIEVSTLTGGQLVALGTRIIAAMGEDGLRDLVTEAGTAAGEPVWALPLPDDLRPALDSSVADLANVAEERWAQPVIGGLFLAEFVPADLAWVHLDMAGPSWNAGAARDYTPRGATGAGVRTVLATLDRLVAQVGSEERTISTARSQRNRSRR